MQPASHPVDEDSWETGHTLVRDGSKEGSIDDFWIETNENPAKDFISDPHCRHRRCWTCGWRGKIDDTEMQRRFLEAHITMVTNGKKGRSYSYTTGKATSSVGPTN